MASERTKKEWVSTVLQVDFGPRRATAPGPRPKLLPIWTDAKDRADAFIGKLQDALREQEDDDLTSIAEFGLYGVTTGQAVRLMAALRDADSKGSVEAYEAVREMVEDYQDYLDGAPIVDLVENNPFGVPVPLRATLEPALDELERLAAG